jgi:type II secretory pathway component PulM
MKLSPRDRRAIVLGAVVLLGILAVRLVLVPWWDSWSDARERIQRCSAELEKMERKMDRLLRINKRLEEMYGSAAMKPIQDIETVRIHFPKTITDVLKAGGIGFEIITQRPGKALREVPGVEFVPFQIQGKCKVAQLAKCLAEMRKTKTLVILDRVTATAIQKKKKGKQEQGQLNVTLVLGTLVKGERGRS